MHRRTLRVACWLLAAVVALSVVSTALTASAVTDSQVDRGVLQADQPEPDNTVTRVELAADGSATWTLRLRTRLATDENVATYRRFQESFRNDTSRYRDPFRQRMTGVVANANESLDRGMRATNFTVSTSIQEVPRRWGVVTYRFEWRGFAATEGDRVVAGDVFAGGFFLGDGDALVVAAPEGHAIESADPTPADANARVAEWRGREDFADNRPRVVTAPAASETQSGDDGTAADARTTPTDGEETTPEGGPASGLSTPIAAGGVVVALLVTVAALYARRGRGGGTAREGLPLDRAGPAPEADGAPAPVPDETRVRELLAEGGGQMKQSEIVDALEWSKSKTSRVLSEMADEGTVSKLRIGRENVVQLEEDEP